MFKGLLIEKINEEYSVKIAELDDDQLPGGDVTVGSVAILLLKQL